MYNPCACLGGGKQHGACLGIFTHRSPGAVSTAAVPARPGELIRNWSPPGSLWFPFSSPLKHFTVAIRAQRLASVSLSFAFEPTQKGVPSQPKKTEPCVKLRTLLARLEANGALLGSGADNFGDSKGFPKFYVLQRRNAH